MNKNQNAILKFITIFVIVIIPTFIALIIFIIIKSQNTNLKNMINSVENNLINIEKKSIKVRVNNMVDLISYQNSVLVQKLENRVKDRVLTAHKIASELQTQYKDVKTENEIKNLIITTLRPLLWNNGESFIWILDYNGVFQLAPEYLRHMEGSSIIDFQDVTGRFIIKEEIALCKTKEEGFLWDTFTKPGDILKKHYKQVAFVKDFGHYDWYFGSGEYLDTAYKQSNKELLKSIEKISINTNDYIFVINSKGKVLLNAAKPEVVGINSSESQDDNTRKTFEVIVKTLENKEQSFVSYNWKNTKTKELETKHSYVSKIPNSDWIIGSGFYDSSIKSVIAMETVKLYEDYNLKIKYILIVGIIAIFISLIFAYFISKYIKNRFADYEDSITAKSHELEELNKNLEKKVRSRTIALQKSKENLEVLATTDSLTKVHNRYSIMQILILEISRANRYDLPLCVLMYDIDHFKTVNDNYGHDEGDAVLIAITRIVKNTLRDIDIIGRYGGEEFLIILPNTLFKDAEKLSERIRKNVSNHIFSAVGHITISLGLVKHEKNESHNDMFKRLDSLLYKSKNNGRNVLSF